MFDSVMELFNTGPNKGMMTSGPDMVYIINKRLDQIKMLEEEKKRANEKAEAFKKAQEALDRDLAPASGNNI